RRRTAKIQNVGCRIADPPPGRASGSSGFRGSSPIANDYAPLRPWILSLHFQFDDLGFGLDEEFFALDVVVEEVGVAAPVDESAEQALGVFIGEADGDRREYEIFVELVVFGARQLIGEIAEDAQPRHTLANVLLAVGHALVQKRAARLLEHHFLLR